MVKVTTSRLEAASNFRGFWFDGRAQFRDDSFEFDVNYDRLEGARGEDLKMI